MKSNYITALTVGQNLVNEPYLLQDVVERKTKNGRPFLLCNVQDKTGHMGAVFWDVPDYILEWVHAGLIVLVTGRVNQYKDSLQINMTDINTSQNHDLRDFLASSQRDSKEMMAELKSYIHALSQPWQSLVAHILLADSFLDQFVTAPAARSMHHGYIGGLLEHSLSMTKLAEYLSNHYPYVNKDLLITGTLLHDMGKVYEYTVGDTFEQSDDGRLVGHIIRAIVIIEKAAVEINFPEEELRNLVHLVASHHGTLEWGAPIVPKTIEAVLLHQIDLLDSRIQGFFDHLTHDEALTGWSNKPSKMFSTNLKHPPNFK